MTLADTSVWIDHLRTGDRTLAKYLENRSILVHPFVIGELALGSLRNRSNVLQLLDLLPRAPVARTSEVRYLIETRRLYALGIGFVDAHLIASVFLNPQIKLWTRDKQLRRVCEQLGIHASLA